MKYREGSFPQKRLFRGPRLLSATGTRGVTDAGREIAQRGERSKVRMKRTRYQAGGGVSKSEPGGLDTQTDGERERRDTENIHIPYLATVPSYSN